MGKQWKQCQSFILGGSKITADGDCSHEIKRHLLLGRKVMTNLDIILKSRDITLQTPSSQFSSVQLLSCVRLFVNPWTAACQDSLSITKAQSPPKPMSIESVMPYNHLSHPLSSSSSPALNLSQHQGLFK